MTSLASNVDSDRWGDRGHEIEVFPSDSPKRAHHYAGIEHMIPAELMAAQVTEAVAARRRPEFLIIGRTNAMRASNMDDALHRGEAYRKATISAPLEDVRPKR